jgi:hypothetical protein
LKDRVLEDCFWKIYAKDIGNHAEANANGAVLAAEMNVIFESKDLPTVAQAGLLDDGIDVRVAVCEKTTERFWFDCRNETRADTSVIGSDTALQQYER